MNKPHQGQWSVATIIALVRKRATLERELDQRVYRLYGLTVLASPATPSARGEYPVDKKEQLLFSARTEPCTVPKSA